jgi:hypothetical protein
MVHFHIHRQGNYIHYKDLQTFRHKKSIPDKQYLTETLSPQHPTTRQIHSIRLPYKLTCPDCGKAYAGQTGRDFYTRFNEHKQSFRYNSQHSKYAQHLIEHGHAFSNIHNTMEILQFQKKGTYFNTIERFHIYKETIHNNHLNDEYTTTANKIFDTVLQHL